MATTEVQGQLPSDVRGQEGQVECLGLTFGSDEERRAHFRERLREKLRDPEFRAIEGFPIGSDEDILALSDPPYYTASPNPFLEEFIRHYGKPYDEATDDYHREPFATDVSEGKYDPIYKLHPYPTKVPHRAIMRYILHYIEPGDVVFDGFCGTGMTGVAAQMCGDRKSVESLGYEVREDGTILDGDGQAFAMLGARKAILNDLSPAATFISYNYNTPLDAGFEREARQILDGVEAECGWMYLTLHLPEPGQVQQAIALLEDPGRLSYSGLPLGQINYTVWSDVFVCPTCSGEVVFWDTAVDKQAGTVRDEFPCPHCSTTLTKRTIERSLEACYDEIIDGTVRQPKQVPVLISYSLGRKRFEKVPDRFDVALLDYIQSTRTPHQVLTQPMLFKGVEWGDSWRAGYHTGITHVHHFYSKRNLWTLASFLARGRKPSLLFSATRVAGQITKLYRFTYQSGVWGAGGGPLSGTLYVPSLIKELAIHRQLQQAISDHVKARLRGVVSTNGITTQSCSESALIPESSIDYIFVDPPFGGNLMYSELNFLWEAWLKVFTNNVPEAIENSSQGKGIVEYQELMERCFQTCYHLLKPGRWITVEFHNSQNRIWNSIQEALQRAGFVVADVRTLDKAKETFKQVTAASAVKQDLVISAYKPRQAFAEAFEREAGTEAGTWEFVRQHMENLPVFISSGGRAQVVAERQNYLLYDRMVAYHIQRGATIPLSAAEFYAGLKRHFPERDEMYFLPQQVVEYDRKRLEVEDVEQLSLFVIDEKSTIQWLRAELSQAPKTYQELHPRFLRELHKVQYEHLPELGEILEQNFLRDERGQWYVPDPTKQGDLEQLRERALLREFESYSTARGRLRVFRSEAIRAGFRAAWRARDYKTIVSLAERLPPAVVQEDPQLLMYYDNASDRVQA